MVDTDTFTDWLKENTEYSKKVIHDTVSRIRRADNIREWTDDATYLFYLEREPAFVELTVSVRSQLRKAVKLYGAYVEALKDAKND